jgi:hypothetical protein
VSGPARVEDDPPGATDESSFGGVLYAGLDWSRKKARALLTEPRYRTLRWVLLLGLALRLILAPLTSWGVDTPFFTLSAVRMLETGSPYGGNTFFNPPLGPVVELPFFAVASVFSSPQGFVQFVPGLMPLAIRTQMVIPYLPTPEALLLLKLPMILCDTAIALLVYHGVRLVGGGTRAGTLAAAAWFLNPLVIWATAVHGEVDTLAAFCVLAAVFALEKRYAFLVGVFLGLGTFAKLYPLVLVPVAAAVLALHAARGTGWRPRVLPVLRLVGGLGFSALPFLPLLTGLSVVFAHQGGNVSYGGLSVLILFNPNITSIAHIWPAGSTGRLVLVMEGTLAVGAAGSVGVVLYRFYRRATDPAPLAWLGVLALWAVSGSILAILSTQPENVVALLPLLLLAGPLLGRWGRRAYWLVSVAAWSEYLVLLTPVAYFYPLFVLLGPAAVRWANAVTIQYAIGRTAVTQGTFWVVVGVVGGLALFLVWAVATRAVYRVVRLDRGPAAATPVVAPGPPPVPLGWRRRWHTVSSAPPTAVTGGVAAALCMVTLTAIVGVTGAIATPPPPPLQVQVVSVTPGFLTDSVTLRLTSGLTPIDVHLGLLPGSERDRGPIYVFADPAYPDTYGSYTATHQVVERVELSLTSSGFSPVIEYVNGSGLLNVVNGPAEGTLVVLGGVIPDGALSNTTAPLADWVADGGTLVWAGGALGSQEGHPTKGPFNWDPLDWKGQLDLVHYPMTDVGPDGPLLANRSTNLGAAFGTAYNGTPTGANTSELKAHGGFDLGFDSLGPAPGEAPRTSLAYQPVDYGGIYFFGGSFSAQTRPPSDVPNADFAFTDDLSVLIASGFVPSAGSGASSNVQLGTLESENVTLTVPAGEVDGGLVAVVTTPTLPTFLSIWSSQIQPPTT